MTLMPARRSAVQKVTSIMDSQAQWGQLSVRGESEDNASIMGLP